MPQPSTGTSPDRQRPATAAPAVTSKFDHASYIYIETLGIREAILPLRTALEGENLALRDDQVEALMAAESTAQAEIGAEMLRLQTHSNSPAAHLDGKQQLFQARVQRMHDAMAGQLSAQQLKVLDQVLQREARILALQHQQRAYF